jgi:hypothetical protein
MRAACCLSTASLPSDVFRAIQEGRSPPHGRLPPDPRWQISIQENRAKNPCVLPNVRKSG